MGKKTWSIEENPKSKRWFFVIKAEADEESYPSIDDIKNAAIELGIDSFSLLSDEALKQGINGAKNAPGEEYTFPIVIEPNFDARVIVAPDKTSAQLYVRKAADRRVALDLKLISVVLNNSKLKGMNAELIRARINEFKDSPDLELKNFVIASGTPPGRGKDRELVPKIEWLAEEEKDKIIARIAEARDSDKLTEEDRLFPIADAELAAMVEQHQILYELTPAEQGTEGEDVFGKPIAGLPGNDPFIQATQNISIGASGFKAEASGVLIESRAGDGLRMRVIPYADGKATPLVAQDEMSVSLILESEIGAGEPLSATAALDTIAKQGIQGSIDRALIESTIETVRTTKKSAEITILSGKAAIPPGGYRLSWAAGTPLAAAAATLQEGDAFLTAELFPKGADGTNVYGKPIAAEGAQGETLPAHDDTIEEAKEGNVITFVAKKAGSLSTSENGLSISDAREIVGDIDEAFGDVQFPGNLSVRGNVHNGRSVKSTGNLSIEGKALASLLSADENVSMKGGISGAGRGTVWAKKAVHLSFAENARLLAGGDVIVDDYCFQCVVKTNRTLVMGGAPGVLLGGSVRASKGVEVNELGSKKTIRTSISFGQNYLIGDQIEVCEREVQKIKESIEKIDDAMKVTSSTSPEIHELRRKKLELLKRNEKLTVRIFTLKEQFETHIISHVRVENTAYPGVVLESHGRYYEVREPKHHVIFIFDQATGQIVCNPIEL